MKYYVNICTYTLLHSLLFISNAIPFNRIHTDTFVTQNDLEPALAIIKAHTHKFHPYGNINIDNGVVDMNEDGSLDPTGSDLALAAAIPADINFEPKSGMSKTVIQIHATKTALLFIIFR